MAARLAAAAALFAGRSWWAVVLAMATPLASPVAGVFLALAGVSYACSVRPFRRSGLAVAAAAAVPIGVLSLTFPEGGRFMADFTDSDKEQVKVGAKMRMTFRIRDNDTMRGGFKRYFWKAAPV